MPTRAHQKRILRGWPSATLRVVALAAAVIAGCGGMESSGEGPQLADEAPAPPAGAVELWFRLDPRLTTGLYMGERWVSPPVFSIALDADGFVEARARCLDPGGAEADAIATWTPADAGLVVVTPPQGRQVRIAIARAGESALRITCGETLARELAVRAFVQNGVLRAEITQ
jgi:hypothetical protein